MNYLPKLSMGVHRDLVMSSTVKNGAEQQAIHPSQYQCYPYEFPVNTPYGCYCGHTTPGGDLVLRCPCWS